MNTSSSSEDDDPLQEARAYNWSIYLMVAMPYLLLARIGFMIYRGSKTAQKMAQTGRAEETTEDPDSLLDDREERADLPHVDGK